MANGFESIDDYTAGLSGVTATRTVTEADIVSFAGLTEDYSLPHMDRHAMATSSYGSRVAHGLLGSSLVTGMLSLRAPHIIGRGVPGAYLYSFDANYRDGLNVDDTIRIEWRVSNTARESIYPGYGLVTTAFEVVRQDGTAIYDGSLSTLVRGADTPNALLELKTRQAWDVTEFTPESGKAYYVEDYLPGEGGDTDGRTITETDIVNFAGLTGDYSPQSVDAVFAGEGAFGSRTAQGLMVFSMAFGLWISDGSAHRRGPPGGGAAVAGHLNDNASFVCPVRIGDTIRCRYMVLEARASKSKPGVGLITTGLQAINQQGEAVMEGSTILMGVSRG